MSRLNAYAEDPLEFEEFAPADGPAVFPDLGPQRLGRHQECAGEPMCGFLFVDFQSRVEGHVAQFMRQREALAFAPIVLVHNDD